MSEETMKAQAWRRVAEKAEAQAALAKEMARIPWVAGYINAEELAAKAATWSAEAEAWEDLAAVARDAQATWEDLVDEAAVAAQWIKHKQENEI